MSPVIFSPGDFKVSLEPVIEVFGLKKYFPVATGWGRAAKFLKAVDDVSLRIDQGQTLGLVGESGSGKSTVGNLILRLLEPDEGRILFRGQDLTTLKGAGLRQIRRKLQMVFQDPQSSLDPRMTIKKIVGYPLELNRLAQGQEALERIIKILGEVGLGQEHLYRYPHEFSGGQRQRIGIARSLVTGPEFIVFDEPTSALDVSVQAQILNLIVDLQKKHGYTYLFISHDLPVVRHVSHQVAVMYLGHLVETAPKKVLFAGPWHPYTQALMASAPKPDPFNRRNLAVITGDAPSPVNVPPGCHFHPRCPKARPICSQDPPPHLEVEPGHTVSCHLYS
ncbi:MAG: ABC transporter ATP-binding protein [Deltaproteobacteria bacterium]|nr:ABC transporter ATP-binding protein [Deltaproteobacteria bacterium]